MKKGEKLVKFNRMRHPLPQTKTENIKYFILDKFNPGVPKNQYNPAKQEVVW